MPTAALSHAALSPFDFAFRIPNPPRSPVRRLAQSARCTPSTLLPRLRFAASSVAAAAAMWLVLAAPWFLVAYQ